MPDIGNTIMTKIDSWIFHSSANSPAKPTDFYGLLIFGCGCTGASIEKLLELPESPGGNSI